MYFDLKKARKPFKFNLNINNLYLRIFPLYKCLKALLLCNLETAFDVYENALVY